MGGVTDRQGHDSLNMYYIDKEWFLKYVLHR